MVLVGAWTRSWEKDGKFYLDTSIVEMAKLIEAHWSRIDRDEPGANEDFDLFLEERKVQAQQRYDAVGDLEVIEGVRKDARNNELNVKRDERHSESVTASDVTFCKLTTRSRYRIRKRLVALGHDERDVNTIHALKRNDARHLTEKGERVHTASGLV